MASGKSQLIGFTGQNFVAYGLSRRNVLVSHAPVNAPSVDLFVCDSEVKNLLTIQVKTSTYAYRKNRYGNEGYEWTVGSNAVGKARQALWYALVDLQSSANDTIPDVYFVPSKWVGEFVKPDFTMKQYFLPKTVADEIRNNWEMVCKYIAGDNKVIDWANKWDKRLVRWGN